ncbi:MAG: ribbon-helix-helix protein, CopG family [Pseudomonadota bacterium]
MLKKTEKIEIRVSPEEKEALSEAAQRDGRNASEVVREFVSAYVSASREKEPRAPEEKKMNLITKAAFVGLGAAAAGPLAWIAASDQKPAQPELMVAYDVRISVTAPAETGGVKTHQIRTILPAPLNERAILETSSETGENYSVSVAVAEQDGGTFAFQFDICKPRGEACDTISTPKIVTGFGDAHLQAVGKGGENITISLDAKKTEKI